MKCQINITLSRGQYTLSFLWYLMKNPIDRYQYLLNPKLSKCDCWPLRCHVCLFPPCPLSDSTFLLFPSAVSLSDTFMHHTHTQTHKHCLCALLACSGSWREIHLGPPSVGAVSWGVLDINVALVRTASDLPNLPGLDYRLGCNPWSGVSVNVPPNPETVRCFRWKLIACHSFGGPYITPVTTERVSTTRTSVWWRRLATHFGCAL